MVQVVVQPLAAPSARSSAQIISAASFLPVPIAPEMSTLRGQTCAGGGGGLGLGLGVRLRVVLRRRLRLGLRLRLWLSLARAA